jgi:hypothetical protein
MANASRISPNRDEQVAIYLKKRMIGRGRCQVKHGLTDGHEQSVRLQYIQWLDGYVPPFPLLEQPCTLAFDDGTRLNGHFTDVLSGARPTDWLRFAVLPEA